jgi:hypothetical protein
VFNFITNHSGDPRPVTGTGSQPATQWTTGSYAFRVNAQIATASALIPTITTIFLARPDELFEITYIKEEVLTRTVFFWTTTTFFRPKVIGFKTKQLDTELMNWNLEQYAPTMKIFIAKENPGLTHTVTNTMSTEFAGNVGLDTKIGLKFGASAKITRTASVQSTIKLENRDLGNILVDFGDKVVLSRTQIPGGFLINHSTVWGFREYNNGMYAITIMPRRVQ